MHFIPSLLPSNSFLLHFHSLCEGRLHCELLIIQMLLSRIHDVPCSTIDPAIAIRGEFLPTLLLSKALEHVSAERWSGHAPDSANKPPGRHQHKRGDLTADTPGLLILMFDYVRIILVNRPWKDDQNCKV